MASPNPRYTRAFGWDPSSRNLAQSVLESLHGSEAWAAYLARFGPGHPRGYVWIGIDGGPMAPVEYGAKR